MCIELSMCIRRRRRKSFDVPGTESSAAFINKRVVSPTESDDGGRRNDIAMQPVDHKSMDKCYINIVLFVFVCTAHKKYLQGKILVKHTSKRYW